MNSDEEELITHGRTIHWISDDEIEDYCKLIAHSQVSAHTSPGESIIETI